MEIQELRVHLDHQVLMESMDQQVPQDPLDLQALLVLLDPMDPQEQPDMKGQLALQDLQVPLDPQEVLDHKDPLVLLDSLVQLVHKVPKEKELALYPLDR